MLEIMSEEALTQARSNLLVLAEDSRQARALRNDLRIEVVNVSEVNSEARLVVDFYWALYYHDGRGPIRARAGKFLVFFRDPDDDPRINGAARLYPRRASSIRRLNLSKGEFNRLLRSGRLIATKRVGSAKAHPFFELGFASLQARYGSRISALFSECVRESLAADDLLDGEETATFSL